jgi:hypothetical protein
VNKSLERLWVSLVDSQGWRRFAKSSAGSAMFRSRAYRELNMVRRRATTCYKSRQDPTFFQDVETCCIFIGHTKSGSSMLGSLLDAHPNAMIADGADALQYVSAGFSRDQLYHLLLKGSRREAIKGRVTARRVTPYSFLVPGQWQGRYRKLQVIGDTTSETATRRFAGDPSLFHGLQEMIGEDSTKFIQVVRNPYDPISYMMVRGKRTFENAIERYFDVCDMLAEIRKQLNSSGLLTVRYDDSIHQPEVNLTRVCRFLGIEASEDYLKACASILFQSPEQSRQMVEWSSKWIGQVERKIERFDFLEGYSFEH